jgi:hypothetical protein
MKLRNPCTFPVIFVPSAQKNGNVAWGTLTAAFPSRRQSYGKLRWYLQSRGQATPTLSAPAVVSAAGRTARGMGREGRRGGGGGGGERRNGGGGGRDGHEPKGNKRGGGGGGDGSREQRDDEDAR